MQKFSKSENDALSESLITSSISSVLSHCGDWGNGRTNRKKTHVKKTTEQVETHENEKENDSQTNGDEPDNGHQEC